MFKQKKIPQTAAILSEIVPGNPTWLKNALEFMNGMKIATAFRRVDNN